MSTERVTTILGGGLAGLSCGYFLQRAGKPFSLIEAAPRYGGNAVTFERDGFRFDSGAHRFHDKDAEMTAEVRRLLGDELVNVAARSQICHREHMIDFPLSPLNLLRTLGPATMARAGLDLLWQRRRSPAPGASFEEVVVHKYGRVLAERFLLGYTAKLWGAASRDLSPEVAGRRLQGLDSKTFLVELVRGRGAGSAHLDGDFLYPTMGFGRIVDALARECGNERIRTSCAVTRVVHDGERIRRVELSSGQSVSTDAVINTLPLPTFVRLLDPAPPEPILAAVGRLRVRDVRLVAMFLDRETVSDNATVYFPDPELPFTRVSEPRNRSRHMAPVGKTSLVAEIPCQLDSPLGRCPDATLAESVVGHLHAVGMLRPRDLLGHHVVNLASAYPVLDLHAPRILEQVRGFLADFRNLQLCGRGGRFAYLHCHDLMRSALQVARAC